MILLLVLIEEFDQFMLFSFIYQERVQSSLELIKKLSLLFINCIFSCFGSIYSSFSSCFLWRKMFFFVYI